MSAENKDDEKGRKPKELALDAIVGAAGTEEPKPTDLVNDKSSGTERHDIYYIENDTIVLKLMSFSNLSQYVLPPPASELATTTAVKPEAEEHQQPDPLKYALPTQTPDVVARGYEAVRLKKMLETAPGIPDGMLPTAMEGGDSSGIFFREFQKTLHSPRRKSNYLS